MSLLPPSLATLVLAQASATETVDDLVSNLPSEPFTLAIYVLVFSIVVILVVLGLDFWNNLGSMIVAPMANAGRVMGEQQQLPALFLVLMSGLVYAIFALLIVPTDQYAAVRQGSFATLLNQLTTFYMGLGVPGIESGFNFQLDIIRIDILKTLGFFLLLPVTFVMLQYSWGTGLYIAGKLISMRNHQGIPNVVCALAWPFFLAPFIYWTSEMVFLFGIGFYWALFVPLSLIAVAWILIIAREFFKVQWVPTVIGLILGIILGLVVFGLVFTALVIIYGQLRINLPDYF